MKFLASYVMRGQFQALSATVFLGVLSLQLLPAALLSCAIIALYVLRKGYQKTIPVLVLTLVLVYLSTLIIETRAGLSIPLVIIITVPVAICALVLRATASQGIAVSIAIGFAALFALLVEWVTGDAIQWWSEWLKTAILGLNNTGYEDFLESGNIKIMNGLVATLIGLCIVLSLFIGRWLQSLLFNPGEFGKEFNQMVVPRRILVIISIILLLSAVLSDNLLNDLLMVFSVLYFLQGLAILHHHIAKNDLSSSWLFPIYLVIFFLPHYAIMGLAGAGVMDTFLNFRKLPK